MIQFRILRLLRALCLKVMVHFSSQSSLALGVRRDLLQKHVDTPGHIFQPSLNGRAVAIPQI